MCDHHHLQHPLLLVLASSLLLVVVSGVEIVGTSPSQVLIKQGSSLDLYCESRTPYQWCYWAHNGSEYPTTSHKGGGEVREETIWGFQWRKSSTRCGLHISQVELEAEYPPMPPALRPEPSPCWRAG